MNIPRLVVAAPASGTGQTTVATGLMAALAAGGLTVSPHKVGPDQTAPGYHALATGRAGRNLDPWLTSEKLIAPLFLRGAAGADVAVVEGTMGLYDGAEGEGAFASTAHVADLIQAPVVLVVDAASAGRSLAAVVHGFRTFGDVRIGGVVLDRIGSDRHEAICRDAVEEAGLPVLGVLRPGHGAAARAPGLGPRPAAERPADAAEEVRGLGALIAGSCDLDALLALACSAPSLTAEPWSTPGPVRSRPGLVIAVAGGPAFTSGYAEHAELLEAAGAEVAVFDPLRDETLPEGTRGLVIGGGHPERHAAELSANESLRTEIRTEIAALAASGHPPGPGPRGLPVYAESAGLLYLSRALDGVPMCGVIDATATMRATPALGYRTAVAVADSSVARLGERVRGHEVRRADVVPGPGPAPSAAWQWSKAGPDGFVRANCVASHLHLHWAGSPQLVRRFMESCA
ncbi:MAG: cobyrinic acid a,c-diamide synthase [Streptosporangiaceae bacterium]|nr:cobyrinic acid a,c-diamide synthase [Streptosporangiaceae bacterium]